MNPVQILFIALLIWALWRDESWLFGLFFISMAMGALALVPPSWFGGFSLLAPSAAALALSLRLLSMKGVAIDIAHAAFRFDQLAFLLLYLIVAAVTTLFMPRLFQGVPVFPVALPHGELHTEPLGPTAQNLSQMLYLLLSCLTTAAAFGAFQRHDVYSRVYRGIIVGAVFTLLSGLLQILLPSASFAMAQDLFRTAGYAYLPDGELVPGARRITGFLPEASAYGAVCCSFAAPLLLLTPLERRHAVGVRLLGWGCVAMGLLSTSSAAYVALAVLMLIVLMRLTRRLFQAREHILVSTTSVAMGCAVLIAMACLLLAYADRLNWMGDLLNQVLLQKHQSKSYEGRMGWNIQAWQSWQATWGLGVGIGGLRTSNFLLNVLCSTGVLGFVLFGAFIFQAFTGSQATRTVQSKFDAASLKWTLLVSSLVGLLIAPTSDFGPGAGLFMGMLIGARSKPVSYTMWRRPNRPHPIAI